MLEKKKSSHLASPNIDREVDELGILPDQILDGLQFQEVWRLLFKDESVKMSKSKIN